MTVCLTLPSPLLLRFLVSVTATGLFLGSIYADRQHTLRWRTQQEEARKRVIDLTGLTREQLGE